MECACACVLRVVENFVVAYLDVEHPYVQREMTYRKISLLRRLGQLAHNEEQRGEREREKVCVLVQLTCCIITHVNWTYIQHTVTSSDFSIYSTSAASGSDPTDDSRRKRIDFNCPGL